MIRGRSGSLGSQSIHVIRYRVEHPEGIGRIRLLKWRERDVLDAMTIVGLTASMLVISLFWSAVTVWS